MTSMAAATPNSAWTLTEIKAPNTNWPAMDPMRPKAARTPIADARSEVGNDSADKQSSCDTRHDSTGIP